MQKKEQEENQKGLQGKPQMKTSMTDAAICIKELRWDFGDRTVLDNISFSVEKGEIFGLLGPSGAGKTTLINILTGQLKATAGESAILGVPSGEMTGGDYRQLGIMMDNFGLYERMSCYDNLRFYEMIDGKDNSRGNRDAVSQNNRDDRENNRNNGDSGRTSIDDVLQGVGLAEAKKRRVMDLSKGMKNRLAFARAILRKPGILFLDEPTSGLDPTTVEAIHQMILEEKEKGTTIFLTTHNMYEAEKLCDRIALLNDGELVEYGAPSDICRRYNHQKKIHIHLKNGEDITLDHRKESAETIKKYLEQEEVETIHSTESNLESVFMELTGRKFES